jgi:hypothetical protein
MAPEQLVLLALFLIVGLVNFVIRWLRERQQTRPPELPERVEIPELIVRRTPLPPPEVPTVAPQRPPRRHPVPSSHRRMQVRLDSRADLRRAIVLTTVLGPPRALEQDVTTPPGLSR